MAANFLPIMLGGAALLFLSGSKKKRRSSKSTSTTEPSDTEDKKALPGLEEEEDEDLDKADTKPTPDPTPGPTPDPDPGPTPSVPGLPEPSEPYGKPSLGPSGAGTCSNVMYDRDPKYMTPDILTSSEAKTLWQEPNYFFYINHTYQKKIYDYMLNRFAAMNNGQESRTVASVVLRDALKHFNAGCNWEGPIDSLGEPEKLVWDSGHRLAIMAQVTVGLQDPSHDQMFQTGERFTITRNSLGTDDPGFVGVSSEQKQALIGRRVELIASDESQENAEHIIGEIVNMSGPNGEPNMFEVRIVGTFQGSDVAPRLRLKHRFKVDSNAFFSQKGPTGIYRIFQEGME